MRVIIFIESFPVFSQTFIYNQFFELYNKGVDVRLVSIYSRDSRVEHGIVSFIKSTDKIIYFRKGFEFKLILNFFKYFKSVKNLFFKVDIKETLYLTLNYDILRMIDSFDIVHSHFGDVGEYISRFYKLKIFKKVNLVNSFHGFDISPDKLAEYKYIYQNLIKISKKNIANSFYSYTLIEKIDKNLASKTEIVPLGVDINYFSKKNNIKTSRFTLIFVGRLIKLKGPYLAVDIVFNLRKVISNLKLHIVGDGEEFFNLEKYIQNLNLKDNIVLHGAKSAEEVRKLYDESDILIAPGITDPNNGRVETQGLVIQEAQSMSIPVLVSDCGGMKYGLIDGATGFVIKEGDVKAFCKKIIYLFENPSVRIAIGVAGRKYVIENFDNSKLTKNLIFIYSQICNNNYLE